METRSNTASQQPSQQQTNLQTKAKLTFPFLFQRRLHQARTVPGSHVRQAEGAREVSPTTLQSFDRPETKTRRAQQRLSSNNE